MNCSAFMNEIFLFVYYYVTSYHTAQRLKTVIITCSGSYESRICEGAQLGSLISTGRTTTGISIFNKAHSIVCLPSWSCLASSPPCSLQAIHVARVSHNMLVLQELDSLNSSQIPLEEDFQRPRWKLQAFLRPSLENPIILFLPHYFGKMTNSSHWSVTWSVLELFIFSEFL